MDQFINFLNSTKKPSKKYRIISKKFIVGQTYLKFDGYHDNVKYDEHTSDI